MTHPRSLTDRDLALIDWYANCQLGLSPRRFYTRWDLSHETIARLCNRAPATVHRWFARGRNYRAPSPSDLRHLALVDFLLRHFDDIPSELFDLLCPPLQP